MLYRGYSTLAGLAGAAVYSSADTDGLRATSICRISLLLIRWLCLHNCNRRPDYTIQVFALAYRPLLPGSPGLNCANLAPSRITIKQLWQHLPSALRLEPKQNPTMPPYLTREGDRRTRGVR